MLKNDFLDEMEKLKKHFHIDDFDNERENWWNKFKNMNLAIFRQGIDHIIETRKTRIFPTIAIMYEATRRGYGGGSGSIHKEHYPVVECDCDSCIKYKRIERCQCIYCGSEELHPFDRTFCIRHHVEYKYSYCLCEFCEKGRKILLEKKEKEEGEREPEYQEVDDIDDIL